MEKNSLLTQVSKLLFKAWTQKLSSTRNPSSSLRGLQITTEDKNPETMQLRVYMYICLCLSVCLSSFSSPPMQTNTRTSSRILCNNCQNTHNHFQPINSIIITSIFFFLFIRETPQCNSTIPSVNITMRIMFLSQGNFFNYENHPSLIIIFCFFFISQTPTCNLTIFLNHNMITHHPSPIHHPSTSSSSPSFLKLLHTT